MTTDTTPDAPGLQLPAPYTTATGFALYTADQMHQYARDYAAMLAAAPSAPAEGGDYSACCDTPAYCSSVRRCTAKDAPEPLAHGQCVGVWNGNAAASGEPGGPVEWTTGLTYSSFPDGTKLYASPQPAAEGPVAEVDKLLVATSPFVDRIIRIFRDHPNDDTSAIVLHDYARECMQKMGRENGSQGEDK